MVGFSLTKEQLLQQQLYRKFAETEVKPKAAEMDEAEKYDVSIMDKMAKYGMLGIPFPKEDGGSGASVLSYALCIEELAKVDASTATACSVHTSLCTTLIGTFGTPEQKEKYYRPLAGGKKYGCFGLTAVSYTHLDVYKRQLLTFMRQRERLKRRGTFSALKK